MDDIVTVNAHAFDKIHDILNIAGSVLVKDCFNYGVQREGNQILYAFKG